MSQMIKCPKCGEILDISDSLKSEIERELLAKFNASKAEFEKEVALKRAEYKKHLDELENKRVEFENSVKTAVSERLKNEKIELESTLKQKIQAENLEILNALKNELNQKSKEITELNLKGIELEKIRREKDELEANLRAKAEAELNEKILAEREKISKELQAQNELKFRQKDDALEAMKRQIDELKRKAEQGSEQLQGEVQEVAIEEWLRLKFPLDEVVEIKKGQSGADCVQIVHTREFTNCGKIYYESKRTKDFKEEWIAKFKNDMRSQNADIGILVTQTMPKDMERVGLRDGVWVCSFEEFKGLCFVLRESLVRLMSAKIMSENRSDKMSLLYSYLTGNEFRLSIELIVGSFMQMKSDLESEKRSFERIWKKREKQIEQVLTNTTNMYGALQGIAGNAIADVEILSIENLAGDESDS